MEEINEKILKTIQDGIPVTEKPYKCIGDQLGLTEDEVIDRIKSMLERNWLRRIGCIPHHYNLGFTANGMSAWDVPDEQVDEVGKNFGAFDFVSHCYRRPRHRPIWPYNLFAMVHGKSKSEVLEKVSRLEEAVGIEVDHEVLFSTELLKKQGSRLSE
ncbi:MAG: Lrp/AsnC family transcriptional regulator [Candidatus Bipolaricaulota bacterium]|nr:Lrp/AsnC family transcriptional regulator [Candidatus Bipolaricaulota bacterium]